MNTTRLIASFVWRDWRTRSNVDRIVSIIRNAHRIAMEQRKEEAFTRALTAAASEKKATMRTNCRLFWRSLRAHPGWLVCAAWGAALPFSVAIGPNAPKLNAIGSGGWVAIAALCALPLIPTLLTAWTLRHQHAEDAS